MKKSILFYFVVVLLITVLCVPSSAADFDFSGYSVDELMEAYKAINQEIVDRALEKTAHLKGGVYVGGIDIPIGEYLLSVDNSTGTNDVPIRIVPSGNPFGFGATIGKLNAGCVYNSFIDIQDGDEISIGIDFDLVIKPRGMIQFE